MTELRIEVKLLGGANCTSSAIRNRVIFKSEACGIDLMVCTSLFL